MAILKEFALARRKGVHTVSIGMLPIPIWDAEFKGNIYAAEAALGRAS